MCPVLENTTTHAAKCPVSGKGAAFTFPAHPSEVKVPAFTYPVHPSQAIPLSLSTSSESSSDSSVSASSSSSSPSTSSSEVHAFAGNAKQLPVPVSDRDPHELPTFEGNSLSEPTAPVLYLPPLLSTLPAGFAAHSAPSNTQPVLNTETRLPNIDPASLSLHKALHHFRPLSGAYASQPYAEAFNWEEMELPLDDEREWYIVAFRSMRKAGSDGTPLYDADKLAHEEAVRNGGLILYWYGIPDITGMNLATCIWQSRKHAIAANSQPHHIQAMKLAAASFEVYELERHTLRKVKGETGLTIERFAGGDVGW